MIFQIHATLFRHIIGERPVVALFGRIELATRNGGVGNARNHGCMATCRRCPLPKATGPPRQVSFPPRGHRRTCIG